MPRNSGNEPPATTSVSMTVTVPRPCPPGFFMNAAIDQNCEKYIRENKLEKEVEKKMQRGGHRQPGQPTTSNEEARRGVTPQCRSRWPW
ncbi:MAG: hypothetical protein IPL77_07390 [Flavobacteriales bacterium]|nr:hypothetical protein [Flavobacteriales bacterium]